MSWFRTLWLAVAAILGIDLALQARTDASPQPRQLRVNGGDLSYIEQGTGAPVVFVHGAFVDFRYWKPQQQAVAKQYHFIAYNIRYHGTMPWPDQGQQYTWATHAADLAALIRGLNASSVHLVGLSLGGFLASLVAAEHPELVRSLTLMEPAIGSLLADSPEAKGSPRWSRRSKLGMRCRLPSYSLPG
jgi:pimeloyl-ACP methyl ester carboxylesterase